MKQNICTAITTRLFNLVVAALVLFIPVTNAFSAPCDFDVPSPPLPIISHVFSASQLTNSYCELCTYGYVTVVINNPYEGADMTGLVLKEDLGGSGLTYDPSALTPMRYSLNGAAFVTLGASAAPTITGTNNSILTWTPTEIPALDPLAWRAGNNNFSSLAIRFAVRRDASFTPATFIAATPKQITATLSSLSPDLTNPVCPALAPSRLTVTDTLPFFEPNPVITKQGRNVDAGQDVAEYSNTVYGNIKDDVIWRIQITNLGATAAALQNMRFSDLMDSTNIAISYACPSEATATSTAASNGFTPGAGCVAASNNINYPLGTLGSALVDVTAGGTTQIYLVGKITNSCADTIGTPRNIVSNFQWGCEIEAPVGLTSSTSTGTPTAPTAGFSSFVNPAGLIVRPRLTGTVTTQPVGSKGTMTITITNNTGGSVKNIKLQDVLPADYALDQTFLPTATVVGAYGAYLGMIDGITLTSSAPALPEDYQNVSFSLISSTSNPNDVAPFTPANRVNMLRNGDVLTVTFRVVLINQTSYDKEADLDVTPEIIADGTDPSHTATLTNSLTVTYEDFCSPAGTTKNAPGNPYTTNISLAGVSSSITSNPEDLDVSIADSVYILTDTQTLTLPVTLRNNGGHTARDYHLFVTFGTTMQVTNLQGCVPIALSGTPLQPFPWKVWTLPSPLPPSVLAYPNAKPTVLHCYSGNGLPASLAPGASRTLNFDVVKVNSTNDPVYYSERLGADDLTFRADVVGEITLSDATPLWFPDPTTDPSPRSDGQIDRANNYSLDAVRSKVVGFNLLKTQKVNCNENNPLVPTLPDPFVQIGEECIFHIESGGWFGFETPGFTYIAVKDIRVTDQLPLGQGYVSKSAPDYSALDLLNTSTQQVKGFSFLPDPISSLAEGWLEWRFNQVDLIDQKDEWFRVNVTTRFLNGLNNGLGSPNVHNYVSSNVLNSTFTAVFETLGVPSTVALGPTVVGYPLPLLRTVNQTVTEPAINVVKEVCNETTNGIGINCSSFAVPPATPATSATGDTYDNYIYRITVKNNAGRAPAYDVITTDTLDGSDLMLIVDGVSPLGINPFATDGLDNDGDGLIDGADTDGEGSISENAVKSVGPAIITFSHTHSKSTVGKPNTLSKINADQSVYLYYRVNPDQDAQPAQILTNSVVSEYDSLEGDSGAQSIDPRLNGDIGGAREYSTAPVTATVRMNMPDPRPKKILRLSQPNHNPLPAPLLATPLPSGTMPVSIGEEIEYELETHLPITNLLDLVITDELPAGITCIEFPTVTLSATYFSPATAVTPTCVGNVIVWDFGDRALLAPSTGLSYYDLRLKFIARVDNPGAPFINNEGETITNGGSSNPRKAKVNYTPVYTGAVAYEGFFDPASIQIQEPVITLGKTFANSAGTPVTQADAGDVLTVTVTTQNTATATAYNLRVMDDLSAAVQLTYLGNVGGLDPPDVVDASDPLKPIFGWNTIASGPSRSFTYEVQVIDSVAQPLEPHEVLSDNTINRMYAKWDSLPGNTTKLNTLGNLGADGSVSGLRNGTLTSTVTAPNDYQTNTFAPLTARALSVSKTDQTALVIPAEAPAIGAYRNFWIDINLPEGSTQDVSVSDDLLVGTLSYLLSNNGSYPITYTYTGIASINGVSVTNGVGVLSGGGAPIAEPADNTTSPPAAIWNFGEVITTNENDPTATAITPRIRISYWVRIDNLTTADAGDTLRNSASLNYTNGNTGATEALISSPAQITVVEPNLTPFTKTVTNITSPAALPDAGDILEYTLTLPNAGNATAYDINIVDTLPALLNYYPAFTPTATIGGVAVTGFVPAPSGAPGGPLKWGRDNADSNLDLPAVLGSPLIITYRTIVMPTAEPNLVLSNDAYADWTSLNGTSIFERTGDGCPTIVAPNDHCTNQAIATTTIIDNNSIVKSVIADSYVLAGATLPANDSTNIDGKVRVGDTVTYRLRIRLQEGTTQNVEVVDTLPQGLQYDSIVSVNGDFSAPYGSLGQFSHPNIVVTPAGDASTGPSTLTWTIGNIVNTPDNNAANDYFVIEYVAKVLPNAAIPHVATTTITNNVSLNFNDGNGVPVVRTGSAIITVVQPVIATLSKIDPTPHFTNFPVNAVPVASGGDTMNFILSACNTGDAPAYHIVLSDTLETQFDIATVRSSTLPGSKLQPDVLVNTVMLTPVTDYIYTPAPTDPGTFTVSLNNGLNPGSCIDVNYLIDFDPVAPNLTWKNTVNMDPYWSLPPASAQVYAGLGPVDFFMNNIAALAAPTILLEPNVPGGDVTIGDEFVYRITLPSSPLGSLFDVVVTDVLNPALEFVSATPVSGVISPTITRTGAGSNVILNVGRIDNQGVIDLRVRVANNISANAGVLIDNTASFTYALSIGGIPINGGVAVNAAIQQKIVEPLVSVVKTVANITKPGLAPDAGDVLRYTLSMNASGGVLNDIFSNAYDISIVDTLGLGMVYHDTAPATLPTVTGGSNTIAAPSLNVTGATAGVSTAQVLTWNSTNSSIDIAENSTVSVTYDVVVLDSVLANQTLTNSAIVRWTSKDGSTTPVESERDGSNSPTYNDYFTTPATASLTTLSPNLSKTQVNTTYGPGDIVRIGDVVDFELRLHLPEGTTSETIGTPLLSDVLPQGLKFEKIISVNGDTSTSYTSTGPFTHSSFAGASVVGDPLTGPTTVSWNIGSIINTGDNNTSNDDFVIVYRAHVLKDSLSQGVGAAQPLTNIATLSYTRATGSFSTAASDTLSVRQPYLTVTKTSLPANGSTIAPGELVRYTVVISNSGSAPAYDVQLKDVIPAGMRTDPTGITMVSPALAPVYDAASGLATWYFDTGTADAYTIPAGGSLTVIYTIHADTGLSAGMTMTNQAQVESYCSFDDEAVPFLGTVPAGDLVTGVRQCYAPVSVAVPPTLYSAAASPLAKTNSQATAAIGQQFTYRVTVPATPQATALYDVRILDDLAASAADMSYVSIASVSGAGLVTWTPVVTGTPKNLVITGSGAGGLDIPANQQAVFDITVVLNDSGTNVSGLSFQNTASYTYNQFDTAGPQAAGGANVATTTTMTIVEPVIVMTKTGPLTMRQGVPATFTLDAHNTGGATAWNMTVVDILPNPNPGGMCDAPPNILQVVQTDGATPVTLVSGTDYTATFNATATPTTCTLTLVMTSPSAAIPPGNHLIVTYEATLDAGTFGGSTLVNLAGATEWFSGVPPAVVPAHPIRTYTHNIVTPDPGLLTDPQDDHSVISETPVLIFNKTVSNITTPASGRNGKPGDVMEYTITINNDSLTLPIDNFTLTDELDRVGLNATAMFEPGTLLLTPPIVSGSLTPPADFSNALGGDRGTGLLDIRNLSLTVKGGTNPLITVVFRARLAAVITHNTTVLNQAQLPTLTDPALDSDDLIIGTFTAAPGDEVATPTVITSAPVFEVLKTSLDVSGDPLVLLAGDRLLYTITVKNIGNESANNVTLNDLVPANTTYVAGSTRLNGLAIADISGVSPLQAGMLINAPENLTNGVMRADATATVTNVATIIFEVTVNSSALNGTIISNQAFVNGAGFGSGVFPEKPSDDPASTTILDDPTLDIVGNLPLLRAQKTVAIITDPNVSGIIDPLLGGEVLRYTITIDNLSARQATGAMFVDLVPANTTYVAGSTTLNGVAVPDIGVSPLIPPGIAVNSPASAAGIIAANASSVVTFDVLVNAGLSAGTVISNQGNVNSAELPSEQTDADGNSSNGYQPTMIIVGSAEQLLITKQVSVVGGGPALPGGYLDYSVRVTNTGTAVVTGVVLSDDLAPLAGLVTYEIGSGTLNGLSGPVVFAASMITAVYGDLLPGATVQLRFRVRIAGSLAMGTTITNTGQVTWNAPATATASISIDVGGVPGSASLNGHVWHDTNFDNVADVAELNLAGWMVDVYRNNLLLGSATTDVNGLYSITGLVPTSTIADQYVLRYRAPGAVATTAKLGRTDSLYTNGMQEISGITALSGSNLQNLNLPIDPNGVLYNSILRTPVTGAMLTMVQSGSTVALAPACFEDPAQQGQVTLPSGYYKFDLNFSDPSCPSGGDFLIQLTSPLAYMPGQSVIIPPLTDATSATFSVPTCPSSAADAVPATAAYCESQASEFAPGLAIPANTLGTNYYLKVGLNNTIVPGSSQIFNNHIAVDPRLDNAVTITKIASLQNVTKGQLIPYTITVNNTLAVTLTNINIVDTFPPGFKYVAGSGRLDGQPVEPVSTTRNLTWGNLTLATNTKRVIQLMLIVGSGVKEGKYINRAQVFNSITGGAASPEASATVRVIPDPTLDCSDVIGKVFDDVNLNGYQDEGEQGLPGVRVVTARGLIVTADKYGRFHVTCAVVPDPDRGSNFILKVDDRTLPSGYRITTENPRVQRATRGKMLKFNFGAAIHKVVKLDMSDGVFEPGTTEMRVQWKQRTQLLLGELKKAASVLRLSYLAETEDESLVNARLKIVKAEIAQLWKKQKGKYDLTIETEVFWRTGSPPEKSDIKQ